MSDQPKEQKIYVPKCSAKEITFQSGKKILKLSFHAQTLSEFVLNHANEKGYVFIGVSERKEVGQYGDTHCCWLDLWKPDPERANRTTAQQPAKPAAKPPSSQPELPKEEEDSPPF